jgi:hypothetical protein
VIYLPVSACKKKFVSISGARINERTLYLGIIALIGGFGFICLHNPVDIKIGIIHKKR